MKSLYLPRDWDYCPRQWRNFIVDLRARHGLDENTVADLDILRELDEYSITGYNTDQSSPCTLQFQDEQRYTWFMLKFS